MQTLTLAVGASDTEFLQICSKLTGIDDVSVHCGVT